MIKFGSSSHYILDAETGELIDIPSGSKLTTPEEQEESRTFIQKLKEGSFHYGLVKRESTRHGGFTFLRISNTLDRVTPATVGRLAFLSTYVGFNNQLLQRQRTPITKKDLPMLLGLGKTAANKFLRECENNNLLQSDGDNRLYIADSFFRGALSDRSENYTKLFHSTVRDLFQRLPAKNHKVFGYIVQLAPYINHRWNILCSNPHENNAEEIVPIYLDELYAMLGFNQEGRNLHRFVDAITETWFEFEGAQQALCTLMVPRGQEGNKPIVVVNPHLIYNGIQPECVFRRQFVIISMGKLNEP